MNEKIEKLKREDLPSYKALIDACFGESKALTDYAAYDENAGYTVWVIKSGQQVVASVTEYAIRLFTFESQPCIMLANLAVNKEYRKEGLAKLLLTHVVARAKADGYRSVFVNCLSEAHSAHRLYESLGFTVSDGVKFELNL